MKALVIGGSGPTGPHIVEGLRARGYRVAVLNRGVHPIALAQDVEVIRGDPHFLDPLREALGTRSFDLVVASYGRLGIVAEALAGRAGRFIGIGGFVGYRGFYVPAANRPSGLPIPTPEDAPLVTDKADHAFAARVAAAEAAVLAHHPSATILRYPYVYGPRQLVPREWSVVRRVLDGRRSIVLINGGMGLLMHGFAENIAHAVMLVVDQPGVAAGRIYNCGDEVQLDLRQFVEVAADALGVRLEIASVPDTPATRRAALAPLTDHKLMDLNLIRHELGYRDVVPTLEAVARTVRHYRDNPLERGGEIERRMLDVFDYAAEDRLIDLARRFADEAAAVEVIAPDDAHPYAHPKEQGLQRDHRGR
ncbi:NAD-dependent epimerase/dehydratase family protein [Sphingomonas jatrophae]|uniref:Nucleoside-diphosphate-sugar epimerase n=1 Tax=Sphingomonas jatrophae TaxID=1166337 RepID=A0A1I6KF55_9SPHN|nr:NAD-dependent epimerase/dehydratase family protein [Sphingomonas jatrophae]SFR89869.1 Nucleoside-diphosphate-sugar epimerase [Sphingomonas jatrophae]